MKNVKYQIINLGAFIKYKLVKFYTTKLELINIHLTNN